jgi:NAD(P)-dependent dehydrogenase (short-subunit alcohol dehydrogenase family)
MPILDRFSLAGKVALITGGAGLYGRQILRGLAEAGARTYIASRNLAQLEQVAAEHRSLGHDVRALALDQADAASIASVRAAIVAESGRLHVLVNNAVARPVKKGYFDDAAAIEESMRVNGTGLILVTRALGEVIADGGSIINIGSIMGLVGLEPLNYRGTDMNGWYPDYFFHKGGMANLTRFLASYYGPRGIRCNCLHPGGLLNEGHPEAFVKNYGERTCLGRLAGEDDLAGAVVFLASDASAYVTGTNIPVDGGYTAK